MWCLEKFQQNSLKAFSLQKFTFIHLKTCKTELGLSKYTYSIVESHRSKCRMKMPSVFRNPFAKSQVLRFKLLFKYLLKVLCMDQRLFCTFVTFTTFKQFLEFGDYFIHNFQKLGQ